MTRFPFPGRSWVAVALGFPVAGYIAWKISGPVDAVAAALIGGALTGAGLGAVQWWAAKGALGPPAPWIGSSAAGYAAGLAVGAALVGYDTDIGSLALMGLVSGVALHAPTHRGGVTHGADLLSRTRSQPSNRKASRGITREHTDANAARARTTWPRSLSPASPTRWRLIMRIKDPVKPLKPSLAALAIAALALSGCGGDEAPQPTGQDTSKPSSAAITFPLKEENGSGQSGEAVAQPGDDGGMRMLLKLHDGSGQSNPAHIHDVTCEQYRRMDSFDDQLATVENTLETLHEGRSDSTLSGVSLSARTTGGYSVNVHEPAHPYKVVACGDIPRR